MVNELLHTRSIRHLTPGLEAAEMIVGFLGVAPTTADLATMLQRG